MKNIQDNKAEMKRIIGNLKETFNPEMCRCFVDAFLIHRQKLEVRYQRSLQSYTVNVVH